MDIGKNVREIVQRDGLGGRDIKRDDGESYLQIDFYYYVLEVGYDADEFVWYVCF